MARWLSVVVAVGALFLVGGGCTAAQYSAVARGLAPAVRSQAELASGLLRVEDLPAGYVLQPAVPAPSTPPSADGGQGAGASPCVDVFEQLRGGAPALNRIAASTARVEFGKGDYGPFLQEELLSSGDQVAIRAAVAAFRKLPELCDRFTETDEQGSFTIKLSEANLPALGDESVALKLDAAGSSEDLNVTLGGYLMLLRKGSVVCILIHFGLPGVDVAETEKIARAAVARLD
jgi:hypothetical protein